MITECLLLMLCLLLIIYVYVSEGRPKNYPPGPNWWPYIGNGFLLRDLSKRLNGQHLAFCHLGKKFNTQILGLKLGREFVVVGLALNSIKAILTRDVFTGRPVSFFMKLRCFGERQGITSTDGLAWRERRTFAFRHLKQYGFGKETMNLMILDEVKEIIDIIKTEKIVRNIGNISAPSVLNVLWALVTGKRLKKTDPKLQKLLKLLEERSRAFDMAGGTLNQMPWLRFLAPEKTGYNLLQKVSSQLKSFLMETIDDCVNDASAQKENLIKAFLNEQKARKNDSNFTNSISFLVLPNSKHLLKMLTANKVSETSRNLRNLPDDELIVLLLDLFLGGAQTTSQTLDFAFLLMIRHPEIQQKVHQNIFENVGKDQLPTIEDKPKLAYVEAVLLEVMRMFCVVPIIGPRRCLENTTLNGFFIPKNTTMLLNLYAVHYDEHLFTDPFKFKPERFLNSEGHLINQDSVLAFGLGKRRCLGEALARSCLFLMFAGIMQMFKITKLPDEKIPSLEILNGITIAPKPYSAQFQLC